MTTPTFTNIANMARINQGFHPMERRSLYHVANEPMMYSMDEQDDADFFAWHSRQRVVIGRDT